MLNPNFAIMCNPNSGYDDSFPSTEPFGFNSATYFLPMCTLIGVAISSGKSALVLLCYVNACVQYNKDLMS